MYDEGQPTTTQRDKTGEVLRAARRLRDQTRNIVHEEPGAREAWDELNRAIDSRDDYMARMMDG